MKKLEHENVKYTFPNELIFLALVRVSMPFHRSFCFFLKYWKK